MEGVEGESTTYSPERNVDGGLTISSPDKNSTLSPARSPRGGQDRVPGSPR